MTLTGIVHDFQPSCMQPGGGNSVLTLPLATGHLLDRVEKALLAVGCKCIQVVPAFEPDADYEERLNAIARVADISVVTPDQRGEQFLDGEPADSLLMIDPRYYPTDGFDFTRLIALHSEHRAAAFIAGVSRDAGEKVERVLFDSAGNVRKIQRVFDQLVWGQNDTMIIPACVIPYMLAIHGPQFPLSAMRQRLAARGVPLNDLPAPASTAHLNRSEDLLRICWDSVHAQAGPDRHQNDGHVASAEDVVIAPSARLVGHVVLNAGARVEENATVVGPTLLGCNAIVGRGATVAQSVLLDRARALPDAVVHHQVVAGGDDPAPAPTRVSIRQPVPALSDEHFQVVVDGQCRDPLRSHGRGSTLGLKRIVDIVTSLVGLVLLGPLMLVTAVLVRATSPGPAFFTHRREGKDSSVFGCIKFRTMRTDAHDLQREIAAKNEADGPQFTITNDPRVTPLGRFLRATNIDELPQLVNVLLGQMSLVGPRPSPFRENQVCAPWRSARLSVRPGITGLWQICRHARAEGDFHQWIYYDTVYVRNLSMWLDCKILFYTIVTLGGSRSVPLNKILVEDVPSAFTVRGHGPQPVQS